MEYSTTTWRIHNIKKYTKRSALLKVLTESIGHQDFTLSFKDHKRLAILITKEEELPTIMFRNTELDIRKQKKEEKDVKDIVTPLNGLSYEEQLKKKAKEFSTCYSFLECMEDQIVSVASPVQMGYRNKCEFTFGVTHEGKEILGFRPTKFSSAPNLVADPKECVFNTPDEMLALVEKINQYLSSKSGHVFNRVTKEGFLRLLLLRRLGEHFITILQVNCESVKEALGNPLIMEFIEILPEDVFISCTTGVFDGIARTADIYQVKGAPKEYKVNVGECVFQVFPLGFFQINSSVAELMIKTLKDNIQTDNILDICCGSGLLGICLAKNTEKKVIGLEISEESINDAKRNAEENQINAKYYCGSVEKTLPLVLAKIKGTATAVIDPPRSGISDKMTKAITKYSNISEIFYISCSYTSVINNIKNIAKLYTLKNVYCFDMFPYTTGIECLFHFVRKENPEAQSEVVTEKVQENAAQEAESEKAQEPSQEDAVPEKVQESASETEYAKQQEVAPETVSDNTPL
ncbi:tRNA (uracil-5-)-methyltransferase [Nematocida parisii]|nr:tRNA (uracil-5-)-methyltransferase [Nematocida parisii]KAI5127146.1 tRNA (uracil-5-)-methyltransferase [Nematocida parisii]KAI5140136.1 tRNA (uracil-5-)-methyltransferase [Nematocida parisii]KAI5153586.1 tRNA (uracil-5-)-methyltransferase [Nematocida parisii]